MTPELKYLFSLHIFGMKFGLRNIRLLLRAVGDPHKRLKTVHVAGTNGKGSTSSMIAAILSAAGYTVGLYTSPHLVKFNERIRINGSMISDADIARYTKKLRPHIDKHRATFFEAATAIAFKYFADQKVDIAVIETGLGGRLDSTNVITPMVSVITSIGKDHTEQLGKTYRSISAEKAGIIKRHVPVVVGPVNAAARNVIQTAAREKESIVIHSKKLPWKNKLKVQLQGQYQQWNARTAVAAVNIVSQYFVVGDAAVAQGLEQTRERTGLRGRLELMSRQPDILLDVAHNPDGIASLVRELKDRHAEKIVIIFAVMKDKDYRSILQQLKELKPIIIATVPKTSRALPSEEIQRMCGVLGIRCFVTQSVQEAVKVGRKKADNAGLMVVTGSHYLVGEIIPVLEKKS